MYTKLHILYKKPFTIFSQGKSAFILISPKKMGYLCCWIQNIWKKRRYKRY